MTEDDAVLIAGGGPAGATVAALLSGWGMPVIVADSGHVAKAGEVVGPGGVRACDALGVTPLLADPVLASRSGGVVTHGLDALPERSEYGLDGRRAWVIDSARFSAVLRQRAIDAGCEWLDSTTVAEARCIGTSPGVRLRTRGGSRVIRTRFLVDATGRAASLARRLGARRIVDDKLVAIATKFFRARGAFDPMLHVGIRSDGWWYRSDGPDGTTRLALVMAPGQRNENVGMLLRKRLGLLLDAWGVNAAEAHEPFLIDASSGRLQHPVGTGWLAVGDAAACHDAFTGQGLSNALGGALVAAHAIRQHLRGDNWALEAYAATSRITHDHSRRGLDLRYAYLASRGLGDFWSARAFCKVRHGRRCMAAGHVIGFGTKLSTNVKKSGEF